MSKFTLLLAIAAVAVAPSLASAKSTTHAKVHAHAKTTKVAKADTTKNLNADTYHLFANMFAPSNPPSKNKKK